MKMLTIELSEQQRKDLMGLVDILLKVNGIEALQKAVELVNVLNSAKPVATVAESRGDL